jgi:hypothetical protein
MAMAVGWCGLGMPPADRGRRLGRGVRASCKPGAGAPGYRPGPLRGRERRRRSEWVAKSGCGIDGELAPANVDMALDAINFSIPEFVRRCRRYSQMSGRGVDLRAIAF